MPLVFAGTLVVLLLPFLVSLAGQGGIPKMLCFVASLLALLLSVEGLAWFLPWLAGMSIAAISVRERISQRRTA